MIHIDGAFGEGGGQILRSALTLSLISQQPFQINNVRARRSKPGLRPQHLQAVRAAATISQAQVQGAASGSRSLTFEPGAIQPGRYAFDIKTAGSATLLLQTILIPLCLANENSLVTIQGGTHVSWSPCVEYTTWTWLPVLAKLGFEAAITCERAGFFPRGGGVLKATIVGNAVAGSLDLVERAMLERIVIYSAVANLPDHIAERQARQAQKRLAHWEVPIEVKLAHFDSLDKGTLILVLPIFESGHACFFALGERGQPAERVADEAVDQLESFLGNPGAVDPHLADQILIPLALSIFPSQFSTSLLTEHLRTNASVIEQFGIAEIEILGVIGQSGHIRIRPLSSTIQI